MEESNAIEINLSQFAGRKLLGFLETTIQQVHSELAADTTEAILDKLGDANAVAVWLRENVTLDLERNEAVLVQEALGTMLEKETSEAEEDCAMLTAVREKLDQCLAGADL